MSANENETWLNTDVLIIGGGVAAASAALAATSLGVRVLIADQGRLARSGSSATAGGGTAAPFGHTHLGEKGNHDSAENHWRDTMERGRYCNDPYLVSILTQEICPLVDWLVELGVPYAKTPEGLYYQNRGVGHSQPRNCTPVGNAATLTEVLIKEAAFRGAVLMEQTRIVELIKPNDRVIGATAINLKTGERLIIKAGNIVLAAGSATDLYPYSSAAFRTKGDSFRLAYEADALIGNMEFPEFTFIPILAGYPVPCGGSTQLTSRGAVFKNNIGEEFMPRYNSGGVEQNTRALLISAFHREMEAGRGPIVLDCASLSKKKWDEWSTIGHPLITLLKSAFGESLYTAELPLVPALHCHLGGIFIDENGCSDIPGLFVAGEAATGLQGAVRLGGNAIAECLVFGRRAGFRAASQTDNSQTLKATEIKYIWNDLIGEPGCPVNYLEGKIRLAKTYAKMSLGVIRSEETLHKGEMFFNDLYEEAKQARVSDRKLIPRLIDLRGLALTGKLTSKSALMRKESRGGHIRDDFPQENPLKKMTPDDLKSIQVTSIRKNGDVIFRNYPVKQTKTGKQSCI